MSQSSGLFNIRIENYIIRFIFGVVFFAFFYTKLPWAERILALSWNVPELRHGILYDELQEENSEATFVVLNGGFRSADNVIIHINNSSCHLQAIEAVGE